jgi:hypothetical protein
MSTISAQAGMTKIKSDEFTQNLCSSGNMEWRIYAAKFENSAPSSCREWCEKQQGTFP